jgi:xylulose-5-phosphate/fructose-6-phosphate phosphoketolase
VHETLSEEVLFGWLTGWTASGRRGLLISYESFAPLLLTGLVGQLKQRRLVDPSLPSINLLLTSYGWHNAYTHGDPSLATALLATGDPAVHVYTPADPRRTAVALNDALHSVGRVNVVIAGKHTTRQHPVDTIDDERRQGLAIWPHLSDEAEPDLTLLCAGDLAAEVVGDALPFIRADHQCPVRVVNVHDMSEIGSPTLGRYVGEDSALLVATVGHGAAIWGLLAGRSSGPTEVIGWREPPHPMSQPDLARHAGLDTLGIRMAATDLLARRGRKL